MHRESAAGTCGLDAHPRSPTRPSHVLLRRHRRKRVARAHAHLDEAPLPILPRVGASTVQRSVVPLSGIFLAGGAATLFVLAALAVVGIWVPFGWWRACAGGGAVLSLLLMAGFFGATKVLPIALDLAVLWVVVTDRLPPTG